MQRTQIYLGADEVALLDREAARTGASRAELIRRAIRRQYGEVDWQARLRALRESAGVWRDLAKTGEEYVDERRGDINDRLRRLGL